MRFRVFYCFAKCRLASLCQGGLLLLFLLFSNIIFSQTCTLIARVPIQADLITTDHLGNLYVVKNDALFKYDSDGRLLQQYSNKTLGKISSVDATNPLKILVFYRDLSRIVFLDNMLAETAPSLRLQDIQLEQSSLAAASYNSGLWLYNPVDFQLVRLNRNGEEENKTGNFAQLLNMALHPVFMREHDEWLYMNDPVYGILVFDIYGTYFKTIPLKNIDDFQVMEETIIYLENDTLKSYHVKKLEETALPLPEKNVLQAQVQKNRIYLLTNQCVGIYLFSKN